MKRRSRVLALCGAFVLAANLCMGEIGSFTDSRARTVQFEYSLKAGWDPDVPRGVLIRFHGNNIGTQADMLKGFFPGTQYDAYRQDLIPVVVASPESTPEIRGKEDRFRDRPYSGHGKRYWAEADENLIYELIQSEFGGHFSVDFNRIVFWGDSQGTCFLNRFIQRYGDSYGGGFFANCGCSEGPISTWNPPQDFKDSFRVYVRATTGDFLHLLSLQAYGYYKYIIGLDTYGDLNKPGDHCDPGAVSNRDAIHWILNGTRLQPSETPLRFHRISLMEGIRAMTVDTTGVLWLVTQPIPDHVATVWKSVDKGETFEPVYRTSLIVQDLDAVDRSLVMTVKDPEQGIESSAYLIRSDNGGIEFEQIEYDFGTDLEIVSTDTEQRLYLVTTTDEYGRQVLRSDDAGDSWTSLSIPTRLSSEHHLSRDPIWASSENGYLFVGRETQPALGWTTMEWMGAIDGETWSQMTLPRLFDMSNAWDASLTWGLTGRYLELWESRDFGVNWESSELPPGASTRFGAYDTPRITALSDGELLISGGGYDGFLKNPDGEWLHIHGGACIGLGSTPPLGVAKRLIAIDPVGGDIYVTDGGGVFRIAGSVRGSEYPHDFLDSDDDTIADANDAFPLDPNEYLDTDNDGIGNRADDDDDDDGFIDEEDGSPLDSLESVDTDRDGVGDEHDYDDDGDGVPDDIDVFPLDVTEYADSDNDGIGDRADDDDDDDGVVDMEDAFPLYSREWSDTDQDGVGDNADYDDDNDGIPDGLDASEIDETVFYLEPADPNSVHIKVLLSDSLWPQSQTEPYSGYEYPNPIGRTQSYGEIEFDVGANSNVGYMLEYFDELIYLWIDRNLDRDLSNDGPPVQIRTEFDWVWLHVTHPSGDVFPYGIQIGTLPQEYPRISFGGAWVGDVDFDGLEVSVITFDHDIDGVFSGSADAVCVDVNADLEFECVGDETSELFKTGDVLNVNGQAWQFTVSEPGHRLEIEPHRHVVPLLPPASHDTLAGVVRVINHSDMNGTVDVVVIDDQGMSHGETRLRLRANQSIHFNSDDIEHGNSELGLPAVGAGTGNWRLDLRSDLDLEVLSYVERSDGMLFPVHDLVTKKRNTYPVPYFIVEDENERLGYLRIVNPSKRDAQLTVGGIGDLGQATDVVHVTVPASSSQALDADDLRPEVIDTSTANGERSTFRLWLKSNENIFAMNLLENQQDGILNLSTTAVRGSSTHSVPLFPSTSHDSQTGLVRIINHTGYGVFVDIKAIDENGHEHANTTLTLLKGRTVEFNSHDFEHGKSAIRLRGIGAWTGNLRLILSSHPNIEVLSYVNSPDGVITPTHDVAMKLNGVYRIPFFNPSAVDATLGGDINPETSSFLLLVNTEEEDATVSIQGIDDSGERSESVSMVLPAMSSLSLSSDELKSGTTSISGSLGEGIGAWQLEVTSDRDLQVMAYLENRTSGILSNMTTSPRRVAMKPQTEDMTASKAARAQTSEDRLSPSSLDAVTPETFIDYGSRYVRPISVDR